MTLLETQRRVAAALMVPLTPQGRIRRKTKDGTLMSREAARLIKPNDRLTSLERLEIYSRSYWFRLLDSLYDDFPGLAAILGWSAFERLAKAYLSECPSRSFTLRNLGSQLEAWLRTHTKYAGTDQTLALDMVRLEWAHVVAFDGPEQKVLGPEGLLVLAPNLRMGVQPYISLLELHYPVDELRIKIRACHEGSGVASNVALSKKRRAVHQVRRLRPQRIFVAVHRLDLSVYYRRLSREEFRLLQSLRAGRSIAGAIRLAFQGDSLDPAEVPSMLKAWFRAWAEFGWLSVRPIRKEVSTAL
jgi:putative DNA-binding protein